MAFTDFEQFKKLLSEAKQMLIVLRPDDDGDAIAAALTVQTLFESEHKHADIVAANFSVPKKLKFLPKIEEITDRPPHPQKFIIRVDVSKNPLENLSYDVKNGQLSIYLTPKSGAITKQDLRTAQTAFRYDLIIVIGAPDLESLGEIYHANSDLFFRAPIINIDTSARNEHFGHLNLVDLTAAGTSEIIYRFIHSTQPNLLNPVTATTLLAGITIATRSFTKNNLSPISLQSASELVEIGADREKIVHNLYRTRSLSTLRLWGTALGKLKNHNNIGLFSVALTRADFEAVGATSTDLTGITEELIGNCPEAKYIAVLYETETGDVGGIIASEKGGDALTILRPWSGSGAPNLANFTVKQKTLEQTEMEIIRLLEQKNAR